MQYSVSKREMERHRTSEQALKDAREKARVEEEERQAVRERCALRRRGNIEFEQFLDFKREKYI